jgi:hypothetical protein
MNERITEAELRQMEASIVVNIPLLLRELRRLRGLIEPVEMVWRLSCPSCGITPIEPLGHMRDIVTEARAIREERGEKLCTCLPSHEGFDGTCRNCREEQGRG